MPSSKPCPPGQVRSPTTNRCVKVDGKAAKEAFAKVGKPVPKTKTKVKPTKTQEKVKSIKTTSFSKYKHMLKTLLDFQYSVNTIKIGVVGEEMEYMIKRTRTNKYKVIGFSTKKTVNEYISLEDVLDSFKKIKASALLIANDKFNSKEVALYVWKA